MRPPFAIVLLLATAARADSNWGRLEIAGGPAALLLTSAGWVQGTNDRLRFAPSIAWEASLTFLSPRLWVAVSGAASLVPSAIRSPKHEQVVARTSYIAPLAAAILVPFGASYQIQPYTGAGIVFTVTRHSVFPLQVSDLHVTRLEQPDHPAVMLESGVRYRLPRRWSLLADAKYGPALSTVEVHSVESPRATQRADVHPLVLAAHIAWRF